MVAPGTSTPTCPPVAAAKAIVCPSSPPPHEPAARDEPDSPKGHDVGAAKSVEVVGGFIIR